MSTGYRMVLITYHQKYVPNEISVTSLACSPVFELFTCSAFEILWCTCLLLIVSFFASSMSFTPSCVSSSLKCGGVHRKLSAGWRLRPVVDQPRVNICFRNLNSRDTLVICIAHNGVPYGCVDLVRSGLLSLTLIPVLISIFFFPSISFTVLFLACTAVLSFYLILGCATMSLKFARPIFSPFWRMSPPPPPQIPWIDL